MYHASAAHSHGIPWFDTPALEEGDMDQRSRVTVTGRLWLDCLLLLALAAILLLGAPRLAVYYISPRVVAPSVETTSSSSLHETDLARRGSGVGA
jgi:hypothetical protein